MALLENSELGGAGGMGHWYRSCRMCCSKGFVLRPGECDWPLWRTAERLFCLPRTPSNAEDQRQFRRQPARKPLIRAVTLLLHRAFVRRWAVNRGNCDAVQPQIHP